MKTIKPWAGILMLLSVFSAPLFSATILTGESVTVTNPIDGNVYAAGGQVRISAVINGDLTAGAGELRVLDTVRHDIIVGGGRVRIEGVVGDDLRCGGGEVWLLGEVYGDVIVGAGELEIGRGTIIHGDLVVGGGEVRVYGQVLGSVIVAGGNVQFEGEAAKDAEIRGGEVVLKGVFRGPCKLAAGEITLGSGAEFYGPVRYWQKSGELDFSGKLREGATAVFDPALRQDMDGVGKSWFARHFSFFTLYRLLAGALLIALLLLLFERFFKRSSEGLPDQWLNRLGIGLLYMIGAPVAFVLLFITVIGIPLGLFALFLYIFSLIFAPALTATVGVNALEQYREFSWSKGQRIFAAIGLLAVLHLLGWIPFIGWLLVGVLICIAFGSLVRTLTMRTPE